MDYLQTCRHEGWSSVANYLSADVPHLLKSEDVKDVEEVLSVVFKSPPADLREFIEWVAEVRRQDDGGIVLSEEEKGRLSIKVFSWLLNILSFLNLFFLFFLNYISLKLEVDIHLVTLKFIDLLLTVVFLYGVLFQQKEGCGNKIF